MVTWMILLVMHPSDTFFPRERDVGCAVSIYFVAHDERCWAGVRMVMSSWLNTIGLELLPENDSGGPGGSVWGGHFCLPCCCHDPNTFINISQNVYVMWCCSMFVPILIRVPPMGVTQLCAWVSNWDLGGVDSQRRIYLRHATMGFQTSGEREIQFLRLDRSDVGATSPQGSPGCGGHVV